VQDCCHRTCCRDYNNLYKNFENTPLVNDVADFIVGYSSLTMVEVVSFPFRFYWFSFGAIVVLLLLAVVLVCIVALFNA
jgi:hypothetical protein